MKLLLVEDDARLAEHLSESFKNHGFVVDHVSNQEDLDSAIAVKNQVDFVILDRLLGAHDSKDSLPKIRKRWPATPVLILSAISTPNERTDLINLGADDYLGKPFSTQELIARVRALLRRNSVPAGVYLQIGNLIIDSVKRIISVGSSVETLPAKEFLLLKTLAQESGRVWSRNELLDYVWGLNVDVETNVVEATIANLRKKLGDIHAQISIKNMRNAGYWIEE
jgi:DNA-binding response OmpR family regulator